MIGFRNPPVNRQPIFGEQIAGKVGYVERRDGQIYFCDSSGRRIARVIRYQPQQAPQARVCVA